MSRSRPANRARPWPAPGDVRRFGDAGVVTQVRDAAEARRLAAAVREAGRTEVNDVVGGMRSVLVAVDPLVTDVDELCAWLAEIDPGAEAPAPATSHEVAVTFDGPDLDEVCRQTGLDRAGVVTALTKASLEVAMVGFSPGFAYLTGLPAPLAAVSRRSTPRPTVPAGALALAGGCAAVYPQATPGGWQVVGRSAEPFFDPTTPPYARFAPGDAVRFAAADAGGPPGEPTLPGPAARRPRRATGDGACLVVDDPGLLTVVQDAGRRRLAHLGVPAAGPADPLSHALANLLVGNDTGAPVLEVTARGPVLVCTRSAHLAVVGHGATVTVDGRAVGAGRVFPLAPGQRIEVALGAGGLRAYVAVAGGVSVPSVMGSRSTDVLSWLGPGPLVAGDELGTLGQAGPLRAHLDDAALVVAHGRRPVGGAGPWRLRVLPGPHPEWFAEDALGRLTDGPYVVEPSSSRVGTRLTSSDGSLIERRSGELASEGVVTGAVQVPPDGRPVVLGPDHATTGGYPVLAAVIAADRWVIGQCRPGDEVVFEVVIPVEAARALGALAVAVERAPVGRYPVVAG